MHGYFNVHCSFKEFEKNRDGGHLFSIFWNQLPLKGKKTDTLSLFIRDLKTVRFDRARFGLADLLFSKAAFISRVPHGDAIAIAQYCYILLLT